MRNGFRQSLGVTAAHREWSVVWPGQGFSRAQYTKRETRFNFNSVDKGLFTDLMAQAGIDDYRTWELL